MSFAKEAWPFVLPFLVVAAGLAGLGHRYWALAALLAGGLMLLFFRDPVRRFEGDPAAVLAAADGRVLKVDRIQDPAVGPGTFLRIATFLSVFDVHVQRSPLAGEVVRSERSEGEKIPAYRDEADAVNESHLTVIRTADGALVGVRQIAGLVARRVVPYLAPGDQVERGQQLGLIKFGSRVDLLLPEGYTAMVREGDRVRTGLTPVALPRRGPEP